MARVIIGGGNTDVGKVYLDALFKERALALQQQEINQRASESSTRASIAQRQMNNENNEMELARMKMDHETKRDAIQFQRSQSLQKMADERENKRDEYRLGVDAAKFGIKIDPKDPIGSYADGVSRIKNEDKQREANDKLADIGKTTDTFTEAQKARAKAVVEERERKKTEETEKFRNEKLAEYELLAAKVGVPPADPGDDNDKQAKYYLNALSKVAVDDRSRAQAKEFIGIGLPMSWMTPDQRADAQAKRDFDEKEFTKKADHEIKLATNKADHDIKLATKKEELQTKGEIERLSLGTMLKSTAAAAPGEDPMHVAIRKGNAQAQYEKQLADWRNDIINAYKIQDTQQREDVIGRLEGMKPTLPEILSADPNYRSKAPATDINISIQDKLRMQRDPTFLPNDRKKIAGELEANINVAADKASPIGSASDMGTTNYWDNTSALLANLIPVIGPAISYGMHQSQRRRPGALIARYGVEQMNMLGEAGYSKEVTRQALEDLIRSKGVTFSIDN